MLRRTMLIVAMAGIYVWIRRLQQTTGKPTVSEDQQAEANWASEGGANPAAAV